MKSRSQKNSFIFFVKSAAFLVLFLLVLCADAKPFILKSVDGSWLPMIAQSWVVKNGGVLVKVADGIKLEELKNEIWLKNHDLSIDIYGKDLFFPTTTPDSIFEVLKNTDIDVAKITVRRQNSYENSEMFVKKSGESQFSKDEYIEAVVENRIFDEKNSKVVVFIKIQQQAKTGAFAQLNGKYRIEHVFEMKNGIVDPEESENKLFVPLIMLKKGNKITFVPEKKYEYRVLTITPDFKIK